MDDDCTCALITLTTVLPTPREMRRWLGDFVRALASE